MIEISERTEKAILALPVTNDQVEQEQWVRMMENEDGMYASFVLFETELVQITDWEAFENAWESNQALFFFEPEIEMSRTGLWFDLSLLAHRLGLIHSHAA